MAEIRFSWNHHKARSNEKKHGISFEEAETVFSDEHALLLDAPEHSDVEERSLLLGLSSAMHVLVVCHCVRETGDLIRLISARRATRDEENQYWERLKR